MGGQQSVPVITVQEDLLAGEAAPDSSKLDRDGAPPQPSAAQPAVTAAPPPPVEASAGAAAGTSAPVAPEVHPAVPQTASQEVAALVASSDSQDGMMKELREYRLTKQVLGEGAFAKVRLATSVSTGHQVAVKIIKRKKLDARAETLLQREVKHHEKLRHENIVRLHTWIKGPTKYYLVMEYCSGGDLLQFVNRQAALPDDLARRLFLDLMSGIAFCHALGVYHRDLKLENLMLSCAELDKMKVKIADFGLSDLKDPYTPSLTLCGSPLYAAPELMTEGAAVEGYKAEKSDIWSCGVILYALLASALPFDADDINALVRLIQARATAFPQDLPHRAPTALRADPRHRCAARHPEHAGAA